MAEYINRARVLMYINDIQLTVSDPKKPTILPRELCEWLFDGISTMPTIEVSTEGVAENATTTPTERTGWIPVSERLPEKNGDYIVSLEDSIYPWGRFFNGIWYMLPRGGVAVEFGANEVIAWQPLPEPYKGGDTE